ncbi:hypothetical protein R5R35_010972 [Gryllus longicercus]|uniref:Cytochrome P450 n=1 Tax=Gryllus longicercus TaxID=2509291 RepID=A0AAN9Z665_9ORTH
MALQLPLGAWALALALLGLALWLWRGADPTRRRVNRLLRRVPGPFSLPLLGSALVMVGVGRRDVWKKIQSVVSTYQPIFSTWNGSTPEVHITDADDIETILRSPVNITKGWLYDYLHPWLGTGLLTSTGQKWFAHRKLITPTFHFKILENFQEVFVEKTQILVEKLQKEVGNSKGFDVYPYITRCALDIICETAMGTKINAQEDTHSPYVKAVYEMSELFVKRFFKPWLGSDSLYFLTKDGRRYKEVLNIVHSFTKKVIRERKQSVSGSLQAKEDSEVLGSKRRMAFLDLLLEASEGGTVLSDEDIREEVDTFMFEGHDTTSASLCWTLLLLGNHPEVQERAFEEQAAIFGDSTRQPSIADLAQMKYLERVIKESLRLYPSVPIIVRLLTEDVHTGGFTLPAGCNVAMHIHHAHRNPKHFPNPEVFDPDNFLPERVQGRHPYAYIPFSAGSRNCIGQKFALLEEKTVLSALLRHFRLRALDRVCDVTLLGELILRPADGVRLTLARR